MSADPSKSKHEKKDASQELDLLEVIHRQYSTGTKEATDGDEKALSKADHVGSIVPKEELSQRRRRQEAPSQEKKAAKTAPEEDKLYEEAANVDAKLLAKGDNARSVVSKTVSLEERKAAQQGEIDGDKSYACLSRQSKTGNEGQQPSPGQHKAEWLGVGIDEAPQAAANESLPGAYAVSPTRSGDEHESDSNEAVDDIENGLSVPSSHSAQSSPPQSAVTLEGYVVTDSDSEDGPSTSPSGQADQHPHKQAPPQLSNIEGELVVVAKPDDDNNDDNKSWLVLSAVGVFLLIAVIIFLSLGLLGVFEPSDEDVPMNPTPPPPSLTTLQSIQARGLLKCSSLDPFGEALCQAIAAAIFRVNAPVENCDTSFPALAGGDCDVLAYGATHNMERQVFQEQAQTGFSFSNPFLYDLVKVAGDPFYVECADNNLNHVGDCSGLQMCVWANTTHEEIVRRRLPDKFITLLPEMEDLYPGLAEGACNVIVLEGFVLGERYVREAGYEGPYAIGRSSFAKEPLALVSRSSILSSQILWKLYCSP